jgi:succinoglycan biosynthesis transport protein ExoP
MDQTTYVMEDEIDLRQYVVVLLKYWYWIVGLAVIAAVVVFAAGSTSPPVYQTTTLVTATQSRYELQFDPRFQNVQDSAVQSLLTEQYRTYPALAVSDDVFKQLAEETGWTMKDLKEKLDVPTQSTANLLALQVTGENPEEVANVANTWAKLFVEKANTLYGSQGELEQFSRQKEVVAAVLTEADLTLTAFRQENFDLLQQRAASKNSLLTSYEEKLVRLRQIQEEVALLAQTVDGNSSSVLIAGILAEMINNGVVDDTQPFQIKLDEVDPVAGLQAMEIALQSQITAIETELVTLEQEAATLQAEQAAQQKKLEELVRDRDVKEEAFTVISRKVQEAQIDATSDSTAGEVQVASRATIPTESLPSGRLRNTAVAGVLGLMVGVFGVFAVEWWRAGTESPATGKD